ncbi:hypothetical protein P5E79_13380 [Clostridium perfringens]|uniref:hypothetical protein n=1 Tax=Clostridium perfringens TaxID=1502 RepID=UPI002A2D8C85|nr:hypothetical protein [Clostridium perfringens]MDK0780121.1 hypothetical protein [Clostridium perfringens]
MAIWDRISKEQYEKVVGECNQLKFRIQELERYNANLEERLKEQQPTIDKLRKELREKQIMLDRYHLDMLDKKEIPKEYRSKRRTKTKGRDLSDE